MLRADIARSVIRSVGRSVGDDGKWLRAATNLEEVVNKGTG